MPSPSVVQFAYTASTASLATFGSNVTPGNCVVVFLEDDDGAPTQVQLGGSNDNFELIEEAGTNNTKQIWVDPNSAGGSAAVTSNGTLSRLAIFEISGVGSSPVDVFQVIQSATATASVSVSTNHANEIWLVCAFAFGSSSAPSVSPTGSPWNDESSHAYSEDTVVLGYQVVSATGTAAWSITASGGGGIAQTCSYIVTLAAGGSAASQPDVPQILPGPTWFDTYKPGWPRPRTPVPPPTYGPYLLNNAEGLSNNQSASAGDSGGLSGNAFDQVDIGAGAIVKGDSSRAAHGNLSYRISTPSTGTPADLAWSTQLTTQPQFWFRLYLYFTENPVSNHRVIEFTTTAFAVACGGLIVNTSGLLTMVDGGGSVRITSTNTIPISKWFRVEGFITGSATAGQLEFKLFTVMDGTTPLETQTSANTLNTTGAAGSVKIGPGIYSVANVGPFWVDDIGVSANGYIGPASGISINRADIPQIQPGTTWLDQFKPGLRKPRPIVPAVPAAPAIPLAAATVTIATPAPAISGAGVGLGVSTLTITTPQISVGESFPLGVCTVTIAVPAITVSGAGLALTAATVEMATPTAGVTVSVALSPATVAIAAAPPGIGPLSVSLGVATVTVTVPGITPAIAGLDFPRIAPGPAWLDHFKPGLPKPPPFLPQRITPGGVHLGVCTVTIAVPAITPAYAPVVDLGVSKVTITVPPIEYSRTLIISIASQAGTDDYGNSFPEGISLGSDSAPQVQSNFQTSGASFVFPLNSSSFLGVPDAAAIGAQVVLGSPPYASLDFSGPSASLSGHQDFVEMAMNSANTSGSSSANMAFYYISSGGGATTTAAWDGTGWTFYQGIVVENGTVTDSLTVTGNAQVDGSLTLGMGVPTNYPNSHISTAPTAAEFNAIVDTLNSLISEMISKGMIS